MKPNKIILHCSATNENTDFSSDDIKQWHLQRGFNDIGYHYIIRLDGTIENGRSDSEMGAHCKGHNTNSIGICYIGGIKDGKPYDTRTQSQKVSMYKLVLKLMSKYDIDIYSLHCHNEFSNKACPCFNINEFKRELMLYEMEQNNKR